MRKEFWPAFRVILSRRSTLVETVGFEPSGRLKPEMTGAICPGSFIENSAGSNTMTPSAVPKARRPSESRQTALGLKLPLVTPRNPFISIGTPETGSSL